MLNNVLSVDVIQPFLVDLLKYVVTLVVALIVLTLGYLISVGIGKIVTEILKSIKLNKLFDKEGWHKALQRANVDVNPAEFIGAIFKWVFVIVSLKLTVDILGLDQFGIVLNQVLSYVPNVVAASLMFVVAVIVSDIIEKVVRVAVEGMKVGYGYLASSIAKWAIWIFTFFLILEQLLPNSSLIQILYMAIVYGIVLTVSLGLGLAIGLGGKEAAGQVIMDLKRKIESR